MGYWKSVLQEMHEAGVDLHGTFVKQVCTECFADESIKEYIRDHNTEGDCDFCGRASDDSTAVMELSDLILFMANAVHREYTDAVGVLPVDEGELLGTTLDGWELLDDIGLELPNDENGELRDTIGLAFSDTAWCERDPFGLPDHEALMLSWREFCEITKHKLRFFFLSEPEEDEFRDPDIYGPSQVLSAIGRSCIDYGLIQRIAAKSKTYYRVRRWKKDRTLDDRKDAGPPPIDRVKMSNRMNPPGIPMLYVSEDSTTALDEIVDGFGYYIVAALQASRDLLILDLADLPPVPSMFGADPLIGRSRLVFLHHFADEIGIPVPRDDTANIEYVPTQIVTEYFRTVLEIDGEKIDGIRYPSTRRERGRNLVLFATQDSMLPLGGSAPMTPSAPADSTAKKSPPWIEVVDSSIGLYDTRANAVSDGKTPR